MQYFKIDLSTISAGLTHQTDNLRNIIYYCYLNNLKLIKPIFSLTGDHNNQKEIITDFSDYYDLDGITINGELFRLYNDDNTYPYTVNKKYYKWGLVSEDSMFTELKYFKNVNMIIPYKNDIINNANKIIEILGEYMCIHVRRGDRISNNQMNIDTQPNNIIKIIEKYKPKKVYIMTNALDELKSLTNIKNIYFYTNFNSLNMIKDNYYLFCIENLIMESAQIRCSTFNLKLLDERLINMNRNYYDCYLTNYLGFQ